MEDRRKEDEKINEMLKIITKLEVLTEQVHKAVFEKYGIKEEIERFKGIISVLRWVAGSGGLIAVGLLIIKIIEIIR